MPETLEDFLQSRPPTPDRPLFGRTVLAVEDSRYVSDALRLMCQRSGARLRRADSLRAARRHLRTYRPSVVLVDLGLPDGSGLDLIRDLSLAEPRVDVLLAISGDDTLKGDAIAAGADGFLAKPLHSLGDFQLAVLAHLPPEAHPTGILPGLSGVIEPDEIALDDDLQRVTRLLSVPGAEADLVYAERFLAGLAKCSADESLSSAVASLRAAREDGRPTAAAIDALRGLVARRIDARPV